MIVVHRNNVPHSQFAETKKRLILTIAESKKMERDWNVAIAINFLRSM